MIESHKKRANMGILAGILAVIAANLWIATIAEGEEMLLILPVLLSLGGTVVFIYGCVQYALAKGRNGWWGAFGLMGLIGLIVLVCLRDYSTYQRRAPQGFPVQPIRR